LHSLLKPGSRERANVKWILIEVGLYGLWLALFTALCFLTVSLPSSSQLTTFHESFWGLESVPFNSAGDVYSWLRNDLIPLSMKNSTDLSNLVSVDASGPSKVFASNNFSIAQVPHVVAGTDMLLIGTIRLRQLRVTEGTCDTSSFQYAHISQFCQFDYAFGSTDDSGAFSTTSTPWYLEPGFIFQSTLPTVDLTSLKSGINYPPNGYVIDLPAQSGQAIQTITDLEEFGWIDYRTSAVIAEVNTYHSESNTFVNDQFLFEFTSVGLKIFASQTSHIVPGRLVSFKLTGSGTSQFVLDILNLTMFTLFVVSFVYLFFKLFSRLFGFFFTYVDLAILITFICLVAWRIQLYTVFESDVIDPITSLGFEFPSPEVFWPLSRVNDYYDWTVSVQSIVLILMMVRATKPLLLFQGVVGMVRTTFVINLNNIVSVSLIFALVGLGYSWAHYEILGYKNNEYSTIESSIKNTSVWFLGIVPMMNEWITSAGLVAFSNITFVFLVYIVLVPILIALAINATLKSWDMKNQDDKQNPIRVYIESMSRGGCKDIANIEEDFEKGIDVKVLPTTVRKRIHDRRRDVRRRVENTGYMNPDFDEFSDFVSRYELRLILQTDSYVAKILRTNDANEVIDRFSSLDNMDPADSTMLPEVSEISNQLSGSIRETRQRLHQQLNQIVRSVANIYESAKRINERVKTTKSD
jgi:hypothetical protein